MHHHPRHHGSRGLLPALSLALALAGCNDPGDNPFDSAAGSSTTSGGSSTGRPPAADTTQGGGSSATSESSDGETKLDVGFQDLPGGTYECVIPDGEASLGSHTWIGLM